MQRTELPGAYAVEQLERRMVLSSGPIPLNTSIEGVNIDDNQALTNTSNFPPDPIVAAGPNHVVTIVNNTIEWYTKAGARQNHQRIGERKGDLSGTGGFFATLNPANRLTDSHVIYDQYNNRFVVISLEFQDADSDTRNPPMDSSRLLVAVSDDSDPNGAWFYEAINTRLTSPSNQSIFLDYPALGVNPDALFITGNMFNFEDQAFAGERLIILPKSGLYSGATSTPGIYDIAADFGVSETSYSTLQPAHMYGAPPTGTLEYLVEYDGLTNGTNEFLRVFQVTGDVNFPSFSAVTVNVGDIDNITTAGTPNLPGAPQPGAATPIAVNDRRALNAVWRNNLLYTDAEVLPPSGPDAGQTTAHWFEVSTYSSQPKIVDQGNIGGEDLAAGTYTFFPNIDVSASGTIGIGFAAAGPSLDAGAYYTARLATDTPGTMRPAAVLAAGLDAYDRESTEADADAPDARNRWGDFSGLSLDPADDNTFWVFNQYALTRSSDPNSPDATGRWGTRLGSFTLAADPHSIEGISFYESGGMANNYYSPASPGAAVGPNHLLDVTRDSIDWYTKDGKKQFDQRLANFFGAINGTLFDSSASFATTRALFDPISNRFIVLAVEKTYLFASGDKRSRIYLAVSDDADPNGTWYGTAMILPDAGNNSYADFPGLGVDANAIYFSPNIYNLSSNALMTQQLFIVSKTPFYSGGTPTFTMTDLSTVAGIGAVGDYQPTVMYAAGAGGAAMYLTRYQGASSGGIESMDVLSISNELANTPTLSKTSVTLGDIDDTTTTMPAAPQLGSAVGISTIGRRVYSAVYRNNALYVGTQVIPPAGPDAGQVTAHWIKLNSALAVADQGDIGGEDISTGTYTYFPAVAVDALGDMAVGFSASSSTKYAGAYDARRRASDPAGTIGASGIVAEGEGPFVERFSTSTNGWGPFSSLAIDPADDLTFWAFNAYAQPVGTLTFNGDAGRWGTRWASFTADTTPLSVSIGALSRNPRNAPVSQITVTFSEAVSGFTLSQLSLTRNGGANLLTGSQTLSSSDQKTWTLGNLTNLTAAPGSYVLTVAGGLSSGIADAAGNPLPAGVTLSFTIDTTAPAVTNSAFDFQNPGVPHRVRVTFSEDVSASLDLSDFTLVTLPSNTSITPANLQYDTASNTAILTFTDRATALLADGNYRLSINPAGVADRAGNQLTVADTKLLDFFVLAGDANRSGTVDSSDFVTLAMNFSKSAVNFSGGDFNYDGRVNALDFNILATNYGTSLNPAPAPSVQSLQQNLGGYSPTPDLFAQKTLEVVGAAGAGLV